MTTDEIIKLAEYSKVNGVEIAIQGDVVTIRPVFAPKTGQNRELRRERNRRYYAAHKTQSDVLRRLKTSESSGLATKQAKTDPQMEQEFLMFWSAYPRRVAKPAAFKAWKAASPIMEAVLRDIERRKAGEWAGEPAKFIPHPSSYLNQRRWEDEQTVIPQLPAHKRY
jgi:hypothetical protein